MGPLADDSRRFRIWPECDLWGFSLEVKGNQALCPNCAAGFVGPPVIQASVVGWDGQVMIDAMNTSGDGALARPGLAIPECRRPDNEPGSRRSGAGTGDAWACLV